MAECEIISVEPPNDFKNGKIYKICSKLSDKIYVGSTIKPLTKRFSSHQTPTSQCSSKELIDLGDAWIELIEEYPCTSKTLLELRERYHQDENLALLVNKNLAGGGHTKSYYDKKYYNSHLEKKKAYRDANADRQKAYYKQWYAKKKLQVLA